MKLRRAAALAASITLALAAPSFGAAAPTTVEVGGDSSPGNHPLTAASNGTLTRAMEKTDGSYLTMGCTSAKIPASAQSTVKSGSALSTIFALTEFDVIGCTGPGGSLTFTDVGTWRFVRTGGAVTSTATDLVRGRITNVQYSMSNLVCRYDAVGSVAATFDEATQVLRINEQATGSAGLRMSGITGCGGQLKNDGKVKFSVRMKITSPDGPINALP